MKLTNQGKVTPPIEIDYDDVKICIFRLNALNHPTRRRILVAINLLDKNATATKITEAISLAPKVVEKHLALLVRAKIIYREKTAKQKLIFSINHTTMEKTNRFITEINKDQ